MNYPSQYNPIFKLAQDQNLATYTGSFMASCCKSSAHTWNKPADRTRNLTGG